MINITFGICAEDAANELFIEQAIGQLITHLGFNSKINLIHIVEYTSEVRPKSGGYVSKYLVNFILKGIVEHSLDLCFVGRDSDDEDHGDLFGKMMSDLNQNKLQEKAILFIPVQAIEYWLWYLKEKIENPSILKLPIIDSSKKRWEMKKLVYNKKDPRNKESNPIVNQLSQNINFDWLNAHSASFKHFYYQFESYLKNKIRSEEEE